MSLKEQISSDIKNALKAGEKERLSVLRMVNSRVLEKEVELRTSKGRDYKLNDDEVIDVITSYAKQRRQSIESYRSGGREDLAAKEEMELEILQDYLPAQLSEEEVSRIIDEAIAETGASSPKDMGTVMRVVMPRLKGASDGKVVNALVRQKLSS